MFRMKSSVPQATQMNAVSSAVVCSIALILLTLQRAAAEDGWYWFDGDSGILFELFHNRTPGELLTLPHCFTADKAAMANASQDDFRKAFGMYQLEKWKKNESLLTVEFEMRLLQVMDVSEKDQSVSVSLETWTSWRDCRLRWLVDDFRMRRITMPLSEFWKLGVYTPNVRLLEDISPRQPTDGGSPITVDYNGYVLMRREVTTTMSCSIDVHMYPFDMHLCTLTFEVPETQDRVEIVPEMVYDALEGSVHLLGDGGRISPRSNWMMALLPPTSGLRKCYTGTCSGMYCFCSQITWKLILNRHPDYQLANLMVPASLVVFVSSCVFLLPPGAGDKVGLSLTILLSMLMFTQIMYDTLPDTGSSLPLISQHFMVCTALVNGSCIFATISVAIASSSLAVPKCLSMLVRRLAPYLLFDTIVKTRNKSRNRRSGASAADMPSSRTTLFIAPQDTASVYNRIPNGVFFCIESNDRVTWPVVAALGDRIFFIAHFLAVMITTFTFVYGGYQQWQTMAQLNVTKAEMAFICAQLHLQNDIHAETICPTD